MKIIRIHVIDKEDIKEYKRIERTWTADSRGELAEFLQDEAGMRGKPEMALEFMNAAEEIWISLIERGIYYPDGGEWFTNTIYVRG